MAFKSIVLTLEYEEFQKLSGDPNQTTYQEINWDDIVTEVTGNSITTLINVSQIPIDSTRCSVTITYEE